MDPTDSQEKTNTDLGSDSPQDPPVEKIPEAVDELVTIESSIKSHIALLDSLKEELKKHNEMLKSYLENDDTYIKTSKTAKEANTLKGKAKRALLEQPSGKEMSGKIKTLQEQNNDLKEGLSYYLREYQRITGSNVFEGDDGEIREIVYVARLVKRGAQDK